MRVGLRVGADTVYCRSKSWDWDIFICHTKWAVCSGHKSTSMEQVNPTLDIAEAWKCIKLMENSTVRSSNTHSVSSVCNVQCLQELPCHDVWSFVFLLYVQSPNLPRLLLLQLWISFFSQKHYSNLQKTSLGCCIQLCFAIYNVSNGETVRISKKKKEWCPSLCCGLWRLLLAHMLASFPLPVWMTPKMIEVLRNGESGKKGPWDGEGRSWTLGAGWFPKQAALALHWVSV